MARAPTKLVFGFEGRTALVTGAAGDIGWAVVSAFRDSGATVIATDRDEDALKARLDDSDQSSGTCHLLCLDLVDDAAVASAVQDAEARFGGVDILVNNAAHGSARATLDMLDRGTWDATFAVNVDGVFALTRHVLPGMRQRGAGAIVNIASQLGHVVSPGSGAYSATKAALISLTRSIALDHAGDGIRAVSISPGAVLTDRLVDIFGSREEATEALARKHPLGRLGTVAEVAAAVLFVASDQAGFITGADLLVDGGYTIQ